MSDCCCDVDMYDADPTTILVQRVLVGRKDHICGECGSVIPKGTEHECVQSRRYILSRSRRRNENDHAR
jgi:predicted nucleic acid-binding Zn ribbon protein